MIVEKGRFAERKTMIDRPHEPPVVRQGQILKLARSTAYFKPQPVSETDVALMRRIATVHLAHPFAGARLLSRMFKRASGRVRRRQVGTLMKQMGFHALSRKPHTSGWHLAHNVDLSLLRQLLNIQPIQVWAAAITDIPMKRGFVFWFAVMD